VVNFAGNDFQLGFVHSWSNHTDIIFFADRTFKFARLEIKNTKPESYNCVLLIFIYLTFWIQAFDLHVQSWTHSSIRRSIGGKIYSLKVLKIGLQLNCSAMRNVWLILKF